MAVVNAGILTIDQIDYSLEHIQHSVYGVVLTAANIVAETTKLNNYLTALAAITKLNVYKNILGNITYNDTANPPSDGGAQREWQWLVLCKDVVTTEPFSFRIGGALATNNLKTASDHANLSAADIAAYVTALKAYGKSRAGNNIDVDDMISVGKNDRRNK